MRALDAFLLPAWFVVVAACGDPSSSVDAAAPTDSVHGTSDAANGDANGDAATADATTDAASATMRRAFVTTGSWNSAMLGGLVGADAKCQAEALAASLAGRYLAWLGDTTASPTTRFTKGAIGYVRTDGVVIANSWSDLVDGALAAPLDVTAGATAITTDRDVWTNVEVDGTTLFAIYECAGWTTSDSSKSGALGDSAYSDLRWTRGSVNGVVTSCFFTNRLYCFEQ